MLSMLKTVVEKSKNPEQILLFALVDYDRDVFFFG